MELQEIRTNKQRNWAAGGRRPPFVSLFRVLLFWSVSVLLFGPIGQERRTMKLSRAAARRDGGERSRVWGLNPRPDALGVRSALS